MTLINKSKQTRILVHYIELQHEAQLFFKIIRIYAPFVFLPVQLFLGINFDQISLNGKIRTISALRITLWRVSF